MGFFKGILNYKLDFTELYFVLFKPAVALVLGFIGSKMVADFFGMFRHFLKKLYIF